jgi:hypothetical protein
MTPAIVLDGAIACSMLFDLLAYLELFEDVTPAPESNPVIVVEELRSKVNLGRWRLILELEPSDGYLQFDAYCLVSEIGAIVRRFLTTFDHIVS